MITKRIIPCLDVKNGKVVKGIHFTGLKDAGDPVDLAAKYDKEGADELVFLDITATNEHRKTMLDVVEKTAEKVFIPFTVGGGLTGVQEIRNVLLAGADKVSLNSAAVRRPDLIAEGAEVFGSQCIVLAVDAMKKDDFWHVMINGGTTDTGIDVLEWIKEGIHKGAGEILLTSLDADGTKKGYDLALLREVRQICSVPLIASGGCGSLHDFYDVFHEDAADGALAASLFHYNELTIGQVKQYLYQKGIPVRI